YAVLVPVSRGYPPQIGRFRCVPHPSATRHPESKLSCAAVRLACVRPAASVHSEPGSNSSLKIAWTEVQTLECSRRPELQLPACICMHLNRCCSWYERLQDGQPSTGQTPAQVTCAHCQRSSEVASAPPSRTPPLPPG